VSALRATATYLANMRRYNATGKPRGVVAAPRWPRAVERDYAADLVEIVRSLRARADSVMAGLPDLVRRRDSVRTDEVRKAAQVIAKVREANTAQQAERASQAAGKATAEVNRKELARQTAGRLGVDLTPLLRDPKMAALIEGFVVENVTLIKSLGNRSIDELEKLITRAYVDGTRAEDLAAQISERWGIAERHARLIARDQIGKLNGQVTAARHAELGITRYEWLSMRDGRVRPRHKTRHGKVYSYAGKDAAPSNPGQDVACRCVGKPLLQDIEDEFDRMLAPSPAPTVAKSPISFPKLPRVRKPRKPPVTPAPLSTDQVAAGQVAEKIAAGQFKEARQVLQELLASRGMEFQENALLVAQPSDSYVANRLPDNVRGLHYTNTAVIKLDKKVAKAAQKFSKSYAANPEKARKAINRVALDKSKDEATGEGLKTFVHEVLHGAGPTRFATEYTTKGTGYGLIVEEVTTEVSARAVMGDLFGYDRKRGSYQYEITKTHEAIEKALSCTRERAIEVLEQASLEFKTDKKPTGDAITPRDRLARKIAGISPSANQSDNDLAAGVQFDDGKPATPHERSISQHLDALYKNIH
jgi:SPP1 gp7 family putative phage head morphogenesis protein